MKVDSPFVNEVLDRLQEVGPATARRMFGGYGIFLDGLMFALIADNELYLKADKQSSHFFEEQALPPFSYTKSEGKVFKMSYYLAPESFFEEIDDTRLWTTRAIEAARRAPRKKKND